MAPYRTGIPTILQLLRQICRLLTQYGTIIRSVVPTDKIVYVDALEKACHDFVLNVNHPRDSAN